MNWEPVIGLEIHVELNTLSKMYCECENKFGGPPNTRCCPVCIGMPGTLPALNRQAVEHAISAGLAMHCEIAKETRQYRKNYFYPDLPKGYQISQYTLPLCRNGWLNYAAGGEEKRARIHQIHIEEDAGKLIHDPESGHTKIDYNRCGVPLIEIVTEPDFRSPEDARAFLETVRRMLLYLGISDCRMQEGSLRCDVNVSLRPQGQNVLGPRVEMKNVNTFSGAERAIRFELSRQAQILADGGRITQQTRRWDDERRESILLRTKETAADYRYFPEPDLPVLQISSHRVDALRRKLPELEGAKRTRYREVFGLSEEAVGHLIASPALAKFLDACVQGGARPVDAANMLLGEISQCINESGVELTDSALTPQSLLETLRLVRDGTISVSSAKRVIRRIFRSGESPKNAIQELGLVQLSDEAELVQVIDQVLDEQEQAVRDYHAGKRNALGFLTGQCMRKTGGRANPRLLSQILLKTLERRLKDCETTDF